MVDCYLNGAILVFDGKVGINNEFEVVGESKSETLVYDKLKKTTISYVGICITPKWEWNIKYAFQYGKS